MAPIPRSRETYLQWAVQVELLSMSIWASAFEHREPTIQGAVLAGLMALYLRNYTAESRDEFLEFNSDLVRTIITAGWSREEDSGA